jgi:hypothetical protein
VFSFVFIDVPRERTTESLLLLNAVYILTTFLLRVF